jgi:glutamyl-tRNA synthetase
MSVKVRIAPSPTGFLHVGLARTALFNWLFARNHGGQFILRIEDTDLERSEKKYEQDIIQGLSWLGLEWDNKEIHRQTERSDIYEKYINQLLENGKAFWCHHTKEELEEEARKQTADKKAPRHVCGHKGIRKSEKGGLIRLAVDENSTRKIVFNDLVRGPIEFQENLLGDFSLAKDVRSPLYNFAVVVDDIDMRISHVIRGEDHISNTPKQILIYEALAADLPRFGHLPLILGPDRSKLSKRNGTVSINEYKKDYLPQTLVNFLGLLGYTYTSEIISLGEMTKEFDIAKVHKSGAIFDVKKLNWLNSQYVKKMPLKDFSRLAGLENLNEQALKIITERLEKLSDAGEFSYLWQEPQYDAELLHWKNETPDKSRSSLLESKLIFESSEMEEPVLKTALDKLGQRLDNRGLAYWPLRVALSGREKSPDPVPIALAIGRQKTLERIDSAINMIL